MNNAVMEFTRTAFIEWLKTDEGRLIVFEQDRKTQLAKAFAAGYDAALKATQESDNYNFMDPLQNPYLNTK